MKNDGLKIGTLCFWARQDNPDAYNNIVFSGVHNDIKACNGSYNSVAQIAHKILKHKYVCVTHDGKAWYMFDGVIWKQDLSELNLRQDLSTVVRNQYIHVMNTILHSTSASMTSNKTIQKDSKMFY